MLALLINMILFRYFIFVGYLNHVNQFLCIMESRGNLVGLVLFTNAFCEAHTLQFLQQFIHNFDVRAHTIFLIQMTSLLLQFNVQANLLYQVTFTKLITGSKRLIVSFQEIKVIEPFRETIQFLFYRLFTFPYSRKKEITIT